MKISIRGGTARPIEAGMLERIGQRLRATLEVWFGPLAPLPPIAPADTPPRRFDYPSGVNLVTLPRNYEAVSFQQMRDLADSLDLVRIAIETRKDQVSKMPWSFRERRPSAVGSQHSEKRHSALSIQHSATDRNGSPPDVGIEHLAREEHDVGTDKWSMAERRLPSADCLHKNNTGGGARIHVDRKNRRAYRILPVSRRRA